jgi:hypothetical protein
MKCPLCEGVGEITPFNTMKIEKKIVLAKTLNDNGLSIRDIMKIMGYKSPRSIQIMLKK